MAMGKQPAQNQEPLFIVTADLPDTAGHPFYQKLNEAFAAIEFDRRACQSFYDEAGWCSIPPGVNFRMMLVGYIEGIDFERGIAWRVAKAICSSVKRDFFMATILRSDGAKSNRFFTLGMDQDSGLCAL
jgi:hypothetical protein